MCNKVDSKITVLVDTQKPSGVLSRELHQAETNELFLVLDNLKNEFPFEISLSHIEQDEVIRLSKKHFGKPYRETHCFRGYPTFGSIKQFSDTSANFILHLDCDMIFYEENNFSWIEKGVEILSQNKDIICVLPKGGPPKDNLHLNQGSTQYIIDKKRSLYLFKNFTSRHYLVHKERFMNLLPMKPLWLSWREPLISFMGGKGKMLCWESIVSLALEKSSFWRADLNSNQAWSIHPGDRCEKFYSLLPEILNKINHNQYPEGQEGHFDLHLDTWEKFLS